MRHDLTVDDLGDLLDLPLLATLATRRIDGSVLLSPVWHEWSDGGFLIAVERSDGKMKHVLRDPNVTILVAEPDLPYRGLEISASAEIVETAYGPVIRRIGRRYVGDVVDRMWADPGDGVVIRIAPGRLRAWDFKDDYPEGPSAP